MKRRNVARWCALVGLLAGLAAAAPAVSARADRLPVCGAPGPASGRPPTGPASASAPGACRVIALESAVRTRKAPGFTPSGYHHLGAGTSGEWGGVSGRYSVVDSSIRAGTYDFIASRFMVKRDLGKGNIAWLEAGWAETGWRSPGQPRIYTYNTNTKGWQFYDQYPIKAGDTVWLDLHTDTDGVWQAWLWWNDRWNLLTAPKLPIGESAMVEQYVEVHADGGKPGRIDVPPVKADNVQLRPADGGPQRFWRSDVSTLTGVSPGQQQRKGGYCLDWTTRYDTWSAGDCPD
ncbi:hypothetical protein [Actinoplanes regularis]|uniref:Uncharacterized protein n=1 Tax=Actinoplanes regularis TaxID=52697 RepID=A0A239CA81_9ACTN|nr:hypothetical protein [Actinoplanes regularis]GIE89509.1 hypothetical protein Are01nite_59890 [Actinoplanes regularis]SNS16869.1 hypothetical protein SAMN06264365_11159 [Actinoplanes regularis]